MKRNLLCFLGAAVVALMMMTPTASADVYDDLRTKNEELIDRIEFLESAVGILAQANADLQRRVAALEEGGEGPPPPPPPPPGETFVDVATFAQLQAAVKVPGTTARIPKGTTLSTSKTVVIEGVDDVTVIVDGVLKWTGEWETDAMIDIRSHVSNITVGGIGTIQGPTERPKERFAVGAVRLAPFMDGVNDITLKDFTIRNTNGLVMPPVR